MLSKSPMIIIKINNEKNKSSSRKELWQTVSSHFSDLRNLSNGNVLATSFLSAHPLLACDAPNLRKRKWDLSCASESTTRVHPLSIASLIYSSCKSSLSGEESTSSIVLVFFETSIILSKSISKGGRSWIILQ